MHTSNYKKQNKTNNIQLPFFKWNIVFDDTLIHTITILYFTKYLKQLLRYDFLNSLISLSSWLDQGAASGWAMYITNTLWYSKMTVNSRKPKNTLWPEWNPKKRYLCKYELYSLNNNISVLFYGKWEYIGRITIIF